MKEYRCYLLSRHGSIADMVELRGINDDDACGQARDHFVRQTVYPSSEMRKGRLVHRRPDDRCLNEALANAI